MVARAGPADQQQRGQQAAVDCAAQQRLGGDVAAEGDTALR